MKKISIIITSLFLLSFSLTCFSEEINDKNELRNLLSENNNFSSDFIQKTFNDNELLQTTEGKILIKNNNLFHLSVVDEYNIVSDGVDFWFHDFFIEQVTVYSLSESFKYIPLLLITNNDELLWKDIVVVKNKEENNSKSFLIENKGDYISSFVLTFDSNENVVKNISYIDQTEQKNIISFLKINNKIKINKEKFEFKKVANAILIDERIN
jgi:chaperone LolA